LLNKVSNLVSFFLTSEPGCCVEQSAGEGVNRASRVQELGIALSAMSAFRGRGLSSVAARKLRDDVLHWPAPLLAECDDV
jgi:hypothetical protein